MRFEDERYVRLYTRDTTTWLMLRWEGQTVFALLMRKLDRTGVFDLGGSAPIDAVSAVLQVPEDIVRIGLERLLARGVIEHREDCLICPKFIEAQEASMTPNARAKESRLRRRDMLRQGLDPAARSTVVYFVQSEHGGPIKIGHAEDLAKRLVGLQTSRPDRLVVLAAATGTIADERTIHDRFAGSREKGEWFSATPELLDFVKHVALTKSLDAPVAKRSESHGERGHETRPVTPSRAVPSHAVPSCAEGVQGAAPDAEGSASSPVLRVQEGSSEPKGRKRGRLPQTFMRDDWKPKPEHAEYVRARGLDLDAVLEDFRNHWLAEGKLGANWDARFKQNVDRILRTDWLRAKFVAPESPADAEPSKQYGPPADPTPEQQAILQRILTRPKPVTPLLAEAAAADVGAPVFWTPKPKAGGDS